MGELESLLLERDGDPSPGLAYDILAAWERAHRSPDTPPAGWDAEVRANLAAWVGLALTVPSPSGWMREAGGRGAEPWLILQLEEAELVAGAARRAGMPCGWFEEALRQCRAVLTEK